MLYLWFKALHVISIIAWMAGLLYLPRLYIYHCGVAAGSEASETFKVMERRLLHAIMNPAMIASYIFAVGMLWLEPGWLRQPWMHIKLLLVVALTIMHILEARWRQDFAADANLRPTRFYRIANEVPTLLMMGIVIAVIVKPFS